MRSYGNNQKCVGAAVEEHINTDSKTRSGQLMAIHIPSESGCMPLSGDIYFAMQRVHIVELSAKWSCFV